MSFQMSSSILFSKGRTQLHLSCACAARVRHATFLRRPHRPYTFTQQITLSDGSTYTARTTSPKPIYKSTRDTRNHPLWQPSMDALRNVEKDDAGRLKAFRQKFGRGWDMENRDAEEKENDHQEDLDSFMDLITGTTSTAGGSVTPGKDATSDATSIKPGSKKSKSKS